MLKRIHYECKNCGWKTSIIAQWGDLSPKRCTNKKCNTSFLKNPEKLLTQHPKEEKVKVERIVRTIDRPTSIPREQIREAVKKVVGKRKPKKSNG